MTILLRALLLPFAILYDLATRIRNHLYAIGHKKSFRFDTTVISVGNLKVGGTGKTPMIEYLIRLLIPQHKIATLSRGYGRKTSGLRFATDEDNASTIGDEPFQFHRKFGDRIVVTVGEDRAFAIPNILHHDPSTDVILLDDAFQHRSVDPQLSILLTEFDAPFYSDWVLPAGRLREARSGAKRSDIVVVTKCPPAVTRDQMSEITNSIRRYAPAVPVYFTTVAYGAPISFGADLELSGEVVLVTGIAKSQPFVTHAGATRKIVRHFNFDDHHRYDRSELAEIHEFCRKQPRPVSILTTEKDMVKLIDRALKAEVDSSPWFYVPVQVAFLESGPEFDRLIAQVMDKVKQST